MKLKGIFIGEFAWGEYPKGYGRREGTLGSRRASVKGRRVSFLKS